METPPLNPPAEPLAPPHEGPRAPAHAADHSSTVLIVIAVFKLLKASLLIAVAMGVHHLLNRDAAETLRHWVHAVRIDPENRYIHAGISKVTGLDERTLRNISFGTFAYGALFMVEGLGLLLRKRWAEFMTVISTTGLLPIEVYELLHRPRWAKAVILLANLLIVAYLCYQLYRTRKAAKHGTKSGWHVIGRWRTS